MDPIQVVRYEEDGYEVWLCGDCMVNASNAHDPVEVLGEAGERERCHECGSYGGIAGQVEEALNQMEVEADDIRRFALTYLDGDTLPTVDRVAQMEERVTALAQLMENAKYYLEQIEKEG